MEQFTIRHWHQIGEKAMLHIGIMKTFMCNSTDPHSATQRLQHGVQYTHLAASEMKLKVALENLHV